MGLDWDNKVSEFYNIAGLQKRMIFSNEFSGDTLIKVLGTALNNPPDGSRLAELRQASLRSFTNLLISVGASKSDSLDS